MPEYQGRPPSLGYPTTAEANERRAAKQARGLHSPVGARPGGSDLWAVKGRLDTPATSREESAYDTVRAIREHQLSQRQTRKSSRARSRS